MFRKVMNWTIWVLGVLSLLGIALMLIRRGVEWYRGPVAKTDTAPNLEGLVGEQLAAKLRAFAAQVTGGPSAQVGTSADPDAASNNRAEQAARRAYS